MRTGEGGSIQIPQTGQVTCFSESATSMACAGTGQDGEIRAGVAWPAPRFTDNGDQTVTDHLTGLIWAQDANLMVSRNPEFDAGDGVVDGGVDWQPALNYIAKLNVEAYRGYDDWRLPNIIELRSLMDAERKSPTLPSGSPFTNADTGRSYWSSTSMLGAMVWYVHFGDGGVSIGHKFGSSRVWPVR